MFDYESKHLKKLDKISDQLTWVNGWLWAIFAVLCMIYLKVHRL